MYGKAVSHGEGRDFRRKILSSVTDLVANGPPGLLETKCCWATATTWIALLEDLHSKMPTAASNQNRLKSVLQVLLQVLHITLVCPPVGGARYSLQELRTWLEQFGGREGTSLGPLSAAAVQAASAPVRSQTATQDCHVQLSSKFSLTFRAPLAEP